MSTLLTEIHYRISGYSWHTWGPAFPCTLWVKIINSVLLSATIYFILFLDTKAYFIRSQSSLMTSVQLLFQGSQLLNLAWSKLFSCIYLFFEVARFETWVNIWKPWLERCYFTGQWEILYYLLIGCWVPHSSGATSPGYFVHRQTSSDFSISQNFHDTTSGPIVLYKQTTRHCCHCWQICTHKMFKVVLEVK